MLKTTKELLVDIKRINIKILASEKVLEYY